MRVAKKPHVSRIRAIHLRAPNLSMPALLGISKMAYPTKKMPAPKPKAVALRPRSLLIVSFAKPTLFRSRNAMKYRKTTSGSTRRLTLLIVRSPNSPSDSTDVRDPGIAVSNHEGLTTGTRNRPYKRHDDAAERLRICPVRFSGQFVGGKHFRGAAPVHGTTPAQGRLVFQLPIRQPLGVRRVKITGTHRRIGRR